MAVCVSLQGLADYAEVHAAQEGLVEARFAGAVPDTVLLLEHPTTITVGRAQEALANVLNAGEFPVVSIKRGGDVTLHGPGQLVAYPIIALTEDRRDLRGHLRALEDAGIGLCHELGLTALRDERNTGVWLAMQGGSPRKVMSTGIACRRWVTWHGLALNVDIDLALFRRINPCGFGSSVMTRLADHLDAVPSVASLHAPLSRHLLQALQLSTAPPEQTDTVLTWLRTHHPSLLAEPVLEAS